MAKSVAQHIEEQEAEKDEVSPGTILIVDGHPHIYLTNGKRPYFKEANNKIVIM